MVQLLNLVVHILAAPILHNSGFAVSFMDLSLKILCILAYTRNYHMSDFIGLFWSFILIFQVILTFLRFQFGSGFMLTYMATRFLLECASIFSKVLFF